MKVKRYSYYPKSDLVRIAEGYAYRYDGNGSLIEKGNVYAESGGELEIRAEGDYLRYEYDLLNRLVKVSRLDPDSGRVEVKATYGYNHRNLRTDSEGTVRYVYDLEGNILEEHQEDEVTRYVYRRGRHLAKLSGGRTHYYGTDHLGTTTVMFDGRGDAVRKGETSPFGNDAATSGSLDETVRFTGKEFDEAVGLYYFNARWYDASLGRFTSEDPARDGVNWYVYVGNRPLGAVDPTGMDPVTVVTGIAIGMGVSFLASTASEVVSNYESTGNVLGDIGNAFKKAFNSDKSLAVIGASTAIGAATAGAGTVGTQAAVLGAKTAAGVAAKAVGVNMAAAATGAMTTDVAVKTIKGQSQNLGDTLKTGAVAAALAGVVSGAVQGAAASKSMTASTVDNVLLGTTKNQTIHSPSWKDGAGSVVEGVVPSSLHTTHEIANRNEQ